MLPLSAGAIEVGARMWRGTEAHSTLGPARLRRRVDEMRSALRGHADAKGDDGNSVQAAPEVAGGEALTVASSPSGRAGLQCRRTQAWFERRGDVAAAAVAGGCFGQQGNIDAEKRQVQTAKLTKADAGRRGDNATASLIASTVSAKANPTVPSGSTFAPMSPRLSGRRVEQMACAIEATASPQRVTSRTMTPTATPSRLHRAGPAIGTAAPNPPSSALCSGAVACRQAVATPLRARCPQAPHTPLASPRALSTWGAVGCAVGCAVGPAPTAQGGSVAHVPWRCSEPASTPARLFVLGPHRPGTRY